MKFNKTFKKYLKIYTEGTSVLSQELPVKQGDQVVFTKGWEKNSYMADIVNTSTGERIREMMEQTNDALIATAVKAVRPTSYGAFGINAGSEAANEKEFMVTVSQQYALGLYKNVVEVPMAVLTPVDNGNNLPPLSKNQSTQYKQTTGENPDLNPNAPSPTHQTHATAKDHGINKL